MPLKKLFLKNVTQQSIRTTSNFTDLIQFHLIWQILAKFSLRLYLSLSKSQKKKAPNFCVVFSYSIKRAREIWKFHVVVVQRRQRNVHVQSCCLLL